MIPDRRTRSAMRRAGFEMGAYDGAYRRRFVLFTSHDASPGTVVRREYDTKHDRDAAAMDLFEGLREASA